MFLVYLSVFVIVVSLYMGFRSGDWIVVIPIVVVWLGVIAYAISSNKVRNLFDEINKGKDK